MDDSLNTRSSLDETTRNKKALKIHSILDNNINLASSDLLDIGTGSGHIAHYLSQFCQSLTSVNLRDERILKDGYKFEVVKDERLPFPDNSFDIVLSNHVIEHTNDQTLHLREIHRVLRSGGTLYLATPNKYALMEPHYKLPFLSWLPRKCADAYLKMIKGQDWVVHPLSHGMLRQLTEPFFQSRDISVEIIKDQRKYKLDMYPAIQPIFRAMPTFLLEWLKPIFPSYILLLKKK